MFVMLVGVVGGGITCTPNNQCERVETNWGMNLVSATLRPLSPSTKLFVSYGGST